MGPSFARRGRKRATVVVGAAPGDRHALPTAILADILRGEGLDAIDLGADTPLESFVDIAGSRDDVVAVAVSVGSDAVLPAAADVVTAIHAALPGISVFLGGPAVRDEQVAREHGADDYAASALAVAERCLALPGRPRG
jgi:methanogenic corrinoid protein MtbC1